MSLPLAELDPYPVVIEPGIIRASGRLALVGAESQDNYPDSANELVIPGLTDSEFFHFQLALQGLSAREVAVQRYYSEATVKFHRSNIVQKLGIHSIAGAIRPAIALGIQPVTIDPGRYPFDKLAPREYQGLYWASYDLDRRSIAKKLGVGPSNIGETRQRMLRKLNARNITQAIWKGFELGILELPSADNTDLRAYQSRSQPDSALTLLDS